MQHIISVIAWFGMNPKLTEGATKSHLIKWSQSFIAATATEIQIIWSYKWPSQNHIFTIMQSYTCPLENLPKFDAVEHIFLLQHHLHRNIGPVHVFIEVSLKNNPLWKYTHLGCNSTTLGGSRLHFLTFVPLFWGLIVYITSPFQARSA